MSTLRVLHAADLHLDSPLSGLDRYEGAPVERLRGATRRAFSNLVDFCVEEEVKLLLIAGDLYDGNWRDYSTGLFFVGEMARLREAGVRVVWIRGNHDAASKLTKHLRLPENVRELPYRSAGSVVFEDWGVAVHGRGYPEPHVTEDLVRDYPAPHSGLLNFGLLHTALDGRVGHEPYAPCSLRTLLDRGYDYWALGHVHTREVLHENPWVVFPGNLQGRQLRESGSKGATLISVDGASIARVEHVALDVVRWAFVAVDVAEAANPDDVLELVSRELARAAQEAEGRLVAARVA
ncbi:MAG TPA: DNA repair exonuclease, partial [Polyangiaceae bacterium]